tara:strand:- start:418 stop:1323 length:906 start_codon:yes stop_codon:yes gene_type:complete
MARTTPTKNITEKKSTMKTGASGGKKNVEKRQRTGRKMLSKLAHEAAKRVGENARRRIQLQRNEQKDTYSTYDRMKQFMAEEADKCGFVFDKSWNGKPGKAGKVWCMEGDLTDYIAEFANSDEAAKTKPFATEAELMEVLDCAVQNGILIRCGGRLKESTPGTWHGKKITRKNPEFGIIIPKGYVWGSREVLETLMLDFLDVGTGVVDEEVDEALDEIETRANGLLEVVGEMKLDIEDANEQLDEFVAFLQQSSSNPNPIHIYPAPRVEESMARVQEQVNRCGTVEQYLYHASDFFEERKH